MRVITASVVLLFVAVMATAQEPPPPWTPLIIGNLSTPVVGHFVWSDERGEPTLQCKERVSEPLHSGNAGDLYDCEIAPGRTLDGAVRLLQRVYETNDRIKREEIVELRKKLAALSKWDVLPSGKFVQ